ncbi:MAG TPA: alpha-amylase, partial [Prolixibacteraceae bacterium]|nr:alpha-amylase [Prolixibacteraceae bacterium]
MKSVTLVFLVHQPVRLKRYRFFDIGTHHDYYDDYANETLIRQLAAQCYLPANSLLLRQINRLNGQLKVAFAIPGVTLELFEQYA